MKSMKRVVAASVLLLSLVASACDALGDDVAATVDGREITIEQVTQVADLVGELSAVPMQVTDRGRLDGELARQSLSALVQWAVAQSAMRTLGEEVSDEDRAVVDQMMGQFESAPGDVRSLLRAGFEASIALDRVLSDHWDTRIGQAVLDRIHEELSSIVPRLCIEGWVGPATGAEAVLDVVSSGDDPTAEVTAAGFRTVGVDTAELCLDENGQAGLPPGLLEAFDVDADPDYRIVEYEDPGFGQAAVVFRPLGREQSDTPDRDDPAFVEVAADFLAQFRERGGGLAAQVGVALADVVIDSRFGSGIDDELRITPPLGG